MLGYEFARTHKLHFEELIFWFQDNCVFLLTKDSPAQKDSTVVPLLSIVPVLVTHDQPQSGNTKWKILEIHSS